MLVSDFHFLSCRSAFFFFCNEERPAVRKVLPEGSGVGDVAKELGKRWEQVKERSRFETLAAGDRARYEKVGHRSL